ncbi:MAG: hypothetical protein ACRCY3_01525 [Sphingorhabdus sp.]
MKIISLLSVSLLAVSTSPAWACDLHGFGGGRFSPFNNVASGSWDSQESLEKFSRMSDMPDPSSLERSDDSKSTKDAAQDQSAQSSAQADTEQTAVANSQQERSSQNEAFSASGSLKALAVKSKPDAKASEKVTN